LCQCLFYMSTDVANVSDSGLLLENAVAIGER